MKVLPPIPAKSSHARYVSTAKIYIRSHVIIHLSYFYREYGCVLIASDLVGSVKPGPNNISSSVIMAHWPSNGRLASDSSGLNVGEVQFYLKHSIKTKLNAACHPQTETYLFAYVNWRKQHRCYDWFGVSAKVCLDLFELPNACSRPKNLCKVCIC